MRENTHVSIERMLAGIAVAAVASFAGCGGGVETTSGGTSGASGGASSGGTSGGASSPSLGSPPSGTSSTSGRPETCANGKDPLCGCTLPGPSTTVAAYQGPIVENDGGADAGAAPPWTCEEECKLHHPNGNGTLESCSYSPAGASPPQKVTCNYYVRCVGRRFAELAEPAVESTDAAELLAATAALEAASIDAFLRLARELAHHRAPPALVARARDAAGDERRHTRSMNALASRYGAPIPAPRARTRFRSVPRLAYVLLENAVEGCVRETFGALMAHVQALRATDPVVRRTMTEIAEDESRHAALAWAIDAWGRDRVSASEARRIDGAREDAVAKLAAEIASGEGATPDARLGLPSASETRSLAAALASTLWAA